MKALLITVLMGTAAFAVISGATLSKHDQRNPSEYDEKSCPRRCSEAYYPMCGINQNGETKVFVNDCYMSMENCNQLTHHVYHPTDESDCPDFDDWINEDSLGRRRYN